MLYRVLSRIFGDRVTIEEPIDESGSDRADCVVTLSKGKAAYFIVPRQITRSRAALVKHRRKAYRHIHWVLLPRLLKRTPTGNKRFILSTTPRDLASRKGVENLYQGSSDFKLGSLYYLYAKHDHLVIMRGLHCVHEPNVFCMERGIKLPTEEIIADMQTGQLMAPDEKDDFEEWGRREKKRRQEAEERKRKAEQRRQDKERQRIVRLEAFKEKAEEERRKLAARKLTHVSETTFKYTTSRQLRNTPRALTCHRCNRQVTEWVYEQHDGCLCKACYQPPALPGKPKSGPSIDPSLSKEGTAPHRKELPCLHCGRHTRDWIKFAYPKDHPKGVCLCSICKKAGHDFPYEPPDLSSQ